MVTFSFGGRVMHRVRTWTGLLVSVEIWPVALAVALSMVSSRFLPFALAVAAFFWIVRWIDRGYFTERTPADVPVGLLITMILVTLAATALPEKTIPQALRLATGIALYYAIYNWGSTAARLQILFLGMVLAGFGLALIAPVSVEWAINKLPIIPSSLYERFTLLVSDVIHPNVLAGNIAILFPFPLALLLFTWPALTRLYRIVSILSLLSMVIVLVLTQSRGAWVAVAAAVVAMLLLSRRLGWIGLAGLGLLAAVVAYGMASKKFLESLLSSGTVGTLEGRVEVWSRAVYMIRDFPLTGVGLGSFGDLADVLYPFFYYPPGSVPHAHNLFLQIAVDLGIPGLIAWLAILALAMFVSWQLFRRGINFGGPWATGVGAGLLGCQIALVIHGLTDSVTWGMVRPAPFIWVIWALAIASWKVRGLH